MTDRDRKDDAARKKILARRATFVAATLAGVTSACGANEPNPQPPMICLSQMVPRVDPDAGAGATPTSDLPIAAPPDAGSSSSSPPTTSEDPPPRPCLSVARPHDAGVPTVCLKIAPPSDNAK